MNNLMKFQIALDKVSEISPLLVGDAQNELKVKSEEFLNEVQDSQYIKVPLVGVFSAGKLCLMFLQRNQVCCLLIQCQKQQ